MKENYFLTVPTEVIMKIIHCQYHTSGLFIAKKFLLDNLLLIQNDNTFLLDKPG